MNDILLQTKDENHKNMIIGFIKNLDISDFKLLETEYKFNYYGDRGFIDLLTINKETPPMIDIYEFKTEIVDIGETIRQVKKYTENIKRKYDLSMLNCDIVMYDTIPHIQHFYDNIEYYCSALNINDEIYYAFRFISAKHHTTCHMPVGMDFMPRVKLNLYDILHSIEQTESKNYEDYCYLKLCCYTYLTKSGQNEGATYVTDSQTIEYYKNIIKTKQDSV